VPDPMDAFPPASLDEALARNPEADAYINAVAQKAVELGRAPSWKAVVKGLAEFDVELGSTTNPVKRVVEARMARATSD